SAAASWCRRIGAAGESGSAGGGGRALAGEGLMFYWFVKGVFYPFVRLYLGLTREGLEHLPRRGPATVICNHVSYMDPILLGSAAVPAHSDGARGSMPLGGRWPAPARVHVRFGRPLRFEAGGRRDRDALQAFAQAMLDAIRRLEPAA